MSLTDASHDALKWLIAHNGDGGFCYGGKGKALLAGGEVAPVTRSTWNKLKAEGLIEYYGGTSGRARCRVTAAGMEFAS